MLQAITISNFKGVREPQRFELKPLVLFVGPNSAGKSTVFHALHYAREVLCNRNLDADRTEAGGESLRLGGFRSLVHGHDLNRSIELRIESILWETGGATVDFHRPDRVAIDERAYPHMEEDLVEVYVKVSWDRQTMRPVVEEYAVTFRNKTGAGPVARIVSTIEGIALTDIDYRHEYLLKPRLTGPKYERQRANYLRLAEWSDAERAGEAPASQAASRLRLRGQADALPKPFHNAPALLPRWPSGLHSPEPLPIDAQFWNAPFTSTDGSERVPGTTRARLVSELSNLLVTPGMYVAQDLRNLIHVGPMRVRPIEMMQSAFQWTEGQNDPRWIDGTAAYAELGNLKDEQLQRVSGWLADGDRFNTGYRIERRNVNEVQLSIDSVTADSLDTADPVVIPKEVREQIRGSRVVMPQLVSAATGLSLSPMSVGTGVSQVLPIVVAAQRESYGVVVIEQPELHLHPRLQAELGDLFLSTFNREWPQRWLVETHSECLILRIQRRIKEKAVSPSQVTIYFVTNRDGVSRYQEIELDDNGDFLQPWPDDFFEVDFYERFA